MPPARPSSFSSFSWGYSFHRDLTSDDDFFLVIQRLKPLLDVVLGGGSAITDPATCLADTQAL